MDPSGSAKWCGSTIRFATMTCPRRSCRLCPRIQTERAWMAEPGLTARLALAGIIWPGVIGAKHTPGITITERVNLQMVDLATAAYQVAAVSETMQAEWQVSLPLAPRYVAGQGLVVVWARPQHWMVLAEPGKNPLVRLRSHLGGLASLTEQGDGRCVLRVHKLCVREMLAELLPIDLHPKAFSEGVAAQMHVHIWQV